MSARRGILFTAFEPSGDDHASAVIAELRRRDPDLPIWAWGGPKMEAAGAELVQRTGEAAVMGIPGISKVREHARINRRVSAWLVRHPVSVHVPVDSPAANFPICAIAKRNGCKVVHLVAPQIWAWASWRIRKLRALTDLVLCLLPFEEEWFRARGVPSRFIGHPLFDTTLDADELDARAEGLGDGSPRVALMPGSRPREISRNFPLLLDAFCALRADQHDLRGVVAATNDAAAQRLGEMVRSRGGWPDGLELATGQTDVVVRWCDLALVVSGTVTLQVARQARPMVIVYKSSRFMYLVVSQWIVSTRYFALPNLIAGRCIVPELIPHFGSAEPIFKLARDLLNSEESASRQRAELSRLAERFEGHHAAGPPPMRSRDWPRWTEPDARASTAGEPANQKEHEHCGEHHRGRHLQHHARRGDPPLRRPDHPQPLLDRRPQILAERPPTVLDDGDNEAGVERAQPEQRGGPHQPSTPLGPEDRLSLSFERLGDAHRQNPPRIAGTEPGRRPGLAGNGASRVAAEQRGRLRTTPVVDQTQHRARWDGSAHLSAGSGTSRAMSVARKPEPSRRRYPSG